METVIDERRVRRPASVWTVAEPLRAPWELASYALASPWLGLGPKGDGHPVIVLPGFLADDRSTVGLRRAMGRRNLHAVGWGLGTDVGPSEEIVDGVPRLIEKLAAEHGTTVSLVGWSLGGILAREFTRMRPGLVRDVITLGSPYQLRVSDAPDLTSVGRIFHGLRGLHVTDLDHLPRESDRPPLPCPSTSIYSRTDGVVPWQACISPAGPRAENIEVACSHLGLGFDPLTLMVVIDRLVQPEGRWRPLANPLLSRSH